MMEAAVFMYRRLKKVITLVAGFTVLTAGFIMIITPGPATIVIPAGIAILSREFRWARRYWLAIRRFYRKHLAFIKQRIEKK